MYTLFSFLPNFFDYLLNVIVGQILSPVLFWLVITVPIAGLVPVEHVRIRWRVVGGVAAFRDIVTETTSISKAAVSVQIEAAHGRRHPPVLNLPAGTSKII